MKVLQINSVCGSGSTGRIACDIKDVLKQNGDSCRIAYGRGFYDDPDCFKIENDFTFKAHALLARFTDRQGFYSTAATKRLVGEIERYQPDIIHLHNIHGYYLNIRVLFEYLKQYDRPVVWTLHDCWAFTGHCAHFSMDGCNKWQSGCHHCVQKKNYPSSLLLDRSAANYRDKKNCFTGPAKLTVVTPSHWLAELVSQSFLSKYPTEVIHNGIDLSAFKPTHGQMAEKLKLQNKRIVLGVANIWGERKGLNDFVRLSERLDDDWRIVLVGLSEQQKSGLPDKIVGLTRTENVAELAELYTLADFFVNPTYEDNYPTTNLEALACGTPVITYATGGSPESIDDRCGAVVEQGNIAGLKEVITNGIFSRENCIDAAQAHDKRICFQKYIELYRRAVKTD